MKVVFFQAHPDDLEFNCTHLLDYLVNKSSKSYDIKIASMTRGEFGTPNFEFDDFKGKRLGRIRTEELYDAISYHGLNRGDVHFFGFIDGSVEFNINIINIVKNYLIKEDPNIIFAPEPRNTYYQHPDHTNTGKIIYYIYDKLLIKRKSPRIFYYTTLNSTFRWPYTKDDLSFAFKLLYLHKSQFWMFKYVKPLYKFLGRLYGRKIRGWKYAEGYREIVFRDKKTDPKSLNLIARIILILSIKLWFIDESIYDVKNN